MVIVVKANLRISACLWFVMLMSAISGNVVNKREKIVRITIEHVDVPNESNVTSKHDEAPDSNNNTFLLSEETVEKHDREMKETQKKEIKANIIKKLRGILSKVKEIRQKDLIGDENQLNTEIIPPAETFVRHSKHKHRSKARKKHYFDQSAGMNTGDNVLLVETGEQPNREPDEPVITPNKEPQAESLFGLFENGYVAAQSNGDKTLEQDNTRIQNNGDNKYHGDKVDVKSTENKNVEGQKYNVGWKDLSTEIDNVKSQKEDESKIDVFIPVHLKLSQQELLSHTKHEDTLQVSSEHDKRDNDTTFSSNTTSSLTQVSSENNDRDNDSSTSNSSPEKKENSNDTHPLAQVSSAIHERDNDTTISSNTSFTQVSSENDGKENDLSVSKSSPEQNEDKNDTPILAQVSSTRDKGDNNTTLSSNTTAPLSKYERKTMKDNSNDTTASEATVHDNSDTQIVNVSEVDNYGNNRDRLSGNVGDKNDWGNGTPDIDSENKHYWDDKRKTKVNINNVNHQHVFKDFSTKFFYKSMKHDRDNEVKPDLGESSSTEEMENLNDAELEELKNSVINSTVSNTTVTFPAPGNESKVDMNSSNLSTADSIEHLKTQLKFLNNSKRRLPEMYNLTGSNNLTLNTPKDRHNSSLMNKTLDYESSKANSTVNISKAMDNIETDFCAQKHTGSYANHDDCTRYWLCAGGKRYDTQCPGGLVYNSKVSSCDDPASIKWISPMCHQRSKVPANFKVENEDLTKKSHATQFSLLK